MSKVAVVYYSGSGNTEAMADVIVNALGADKLEAEGFGAAKVADYDAIAFSCPAMGDEVLEETIFQPMWDDVKGSLAGKKVALFGSYGWGDGQWMRDWEARERDLQRGPRRRGQRGAGGAGEGHRLNTLISPTAWVQEVGVSNFIRGTMKKL